MSEVWKSIDCWLKSSTDPEMIEGSRIMFVKTSAMMVTFSTRLVRLPRAREREAM